MQSENKTLTFIILLFIVCVPPVHSQSLNISQIKSRLYLSNKSNSDSIKISWMNINRLASAVCNDGTSEYYHLSPTNYYYFEYPKGTIQNYGHAGIIVGGKVDNEIRVEGTYYHSSLVPSPPSQIYRVRRDYKDGNLNSEIHNGEGTETDIRNTYEMNWMLWPAQNGAPYEDVNRDGAYDPAIDVPGVTGADQTVWFKANDSDSMRTQNIFGSLPLGLDIYFTFWAYNKGGSLGNTIFRQYKFINNSNKTIQEIYCSLFSDLDVGAQGDEYVGCDTTLGLGYYYNRLNIDEKYGSSPPAFGYVYLGDNSNGKKNIGLTAFNPFINDSSPFEFPNTGDYETSAKFWYKLLKGQTFNGMEYVVPMEFGGGETTFPFSGDPVNKNGWNDGNPYVYNNRGINLSVGKFDLAPNESVAITFAIMAAGGEKDISNLEAIDSLKSYAATIIEEYKKIKDIFSNINSFSSLEISDFLLYQNYPNPFNPSTKITYQLPEKSNVVLKIYDALGKEIRTVVNSTKEAGYYSIDFDASDLPSGLYIYQIQAGKFNRSKKMLLVK